MQVAEAGSPKIRDDWKAGLEGMDPGREVLQRAVVSHPPDHLRVARTPGAGRAARCGARAMERCGPELEGDDWKNIVDGLYQRGLLAPSGRALTDAGQRFVAELLFKYQNALPDLSPTGTLHRFRLHVGPIGSGARVVEDERIWTFVSQAMRKTLSIEMGCWWICPRSLTRRPAPASSQQRRVAESRAHVYPSHHPRTDAGSR
jgi:hypothetical protein